MGQVGLERGGLRSSRMERKIRRIDDFSEFGVNESFGSEEKISMKGLDQIVAWSKAWSESLKENRQVI